MPEAPRSRSLNRLRFPADLEREFQEHYYQTYRNPLRYVCAFVAGVYLVLLIRGELHGTPAAGLAYDSVPCLAFAVILGLSFVRGFRRFWQPCFVLFVAAILPLVLRDHARTIHEAADLPTLAAKMDGFFATSFFTLMLLVGIVRVQSLWAILMQVVFFALCVWYGIIYLQASVPAVLGTAQFLLVIQIVLTFNLVVQERLQREAFLANHELARERADERRLRERTEAMLHILGQAIGGIVHDLGNPLTSVQTGAETLKSLVKDTPSPRAVETEFLDIITDGAQMLDYLRLSLLEQTRVLEGRDVPVFRKKVSLRRLIETGAHYQAPKFTSGRRIRVEGEETEAFGDGRRLTTIFMNLIGNALKYSDGEILVNWRAAGGVVLCAVQDQGGGSRGISRREADRLFVAFGRLDAHAHLEGTGLGLVSARKIAEAHGGEIYIEGYGDGTAASPRFTTARHAYPSLLDPDFRTAFVVAFPSGAPQAAPPKSASPVQDNSLALPRR